MVDEKESTIKHTSCKPRWPRWSEGDRQMVSNAERKIGRLLAPAGSARPLLMTVRLLHHAETIFQVGQLKLLRSE